MARARRAAPARRAPAPRRAPPSRPASTKAATPPPAPQQSFPPAQQQPQSGGMLAGIGSTIAQGMAFGTGSAIAHRTVGAVASSFSGSGEQDSQQPAPMGDSGMMQQQSSMGTGACQMERQIYYDCLRDNKDDGAVCQFLLEQLKSCNQNQMYS